MNHLKMKILTVVVVVKSWHISKGRSDEGVGVLRDNQLVILSCLGPLA